MADVTLDDVHKRFGDVSAIEGMSLRVEDRELVVLVGPSGCGKSTALRLIAGLEELSGGTISIGGRVVNDLPPKDRDVAMVFQSYALYPHMTVRGNLEFGLRLRKTGKAETERRVREAARVLEITPLLDRKPRQLSGGQRQRVAVGRAIVREPAVFLFDEPLSNLDARLRLQMRTELAKLQKRLRTTTLYVTHDQVEAMTMGDRIAVMKDGRLQQVGAPLEVYERPSNLFVAGFIGTPPMSFLAAEVADGGASLHAASFRLPVAVPLRAATAGRDGQRVVVGVRPENVLEPGREARGETAKVEVEIEVIEPLGHEVIVHGRAGGDLLVASAEPHRAPRPGETVELAVELAALHLFDAATEERLAG